MNPQLAINILKFYGKMKNVGFYLLPVPRIEAFALPSVVERATSKPTPICITTLEYTFDQQKRTKDINIPRRHPLLLCL